MHWNCHFVNKFKIWVFFSNFYKNFSLYLFNKQSKSIEQRSKVKNSTNKIKNPLQKVKMRGHLQSDYKILAKKLQHFSIFFIFLFFTSIGNCFEKKGEMRWSQASIIIKDFQVSFWDVLLSSSKSPCRLSFFIYIHIIPFSNNKHYWRHEDDDCDKNWCAIFRFTVTIIKTAVSNSGKVM